MIEYKNVSCEYEKGIPVVRNISFSIEDGCSVGLIGANGAGKSTIMKALAGTVNHSGEIILDGTTVNRENLNSVRKRAGFVLQNPDHQMFMPTVHDDMLFGPLNYGVPGEEAEHRADRVLAELGIPDLKEKYNHKLSGGEKRMAAIAVVLAMNPSAVIMDEPTSALDPGNRRRVINAIRGLDITRLIASHDLDMILDTCSKVLLISKGEIKAYGETEEILSNKELLEGCGLELPLSLQRR